MRKFEIKSLVDKIRGKFVQEAEYTNTRVASGSSTTLSGANQSVTTISVPFGLECVITGLYVYGGAATSFTLSYSQTTLAGADTQSIHKSLVSAGDEEVHLTVKNPMMAMVNGSITQGAVTITLSVDSATSGTLYQGDVWYILR